jgi:Ca2+-transporting ATPase
MSAWVRRAPTRDSSGIISFTVFAWAIATGMAEGEAGNLLLSLMVLFESVQVFNARSETRSAFKIALSRQLAPSSPSSSSRSRCPSARPSSRTHGLLAVEPISLTSWISLAGLALTALLVNGARQADRSRHAT